MVILLLLKTLLQTHISLSYQLCQKEKLSDPIGLDTQPQNDYTL